MTDSAILCCGEAVMDLVPATLDDGTSGLRAVPGGAAVNTAVALARQEVPAGFFGALSTDSTGATLAAHLESESVSTAQAVWSTHPSTLSVATPVAGGTKFELFDADSAGRRLTADTLPEIPASLAALVFGGISLIHSPAANTFEVLARRAAANHLIWLDLNIRPGLVSDPDAYRARLTRMMHLADIIKVSDEDLSWWGEDIVAPHGCLIRTNGSQGAEIHLNGTEVRLPAPDVPVQDTIGAGDIFNGGVLACLWLSGDLKKPFAPSHQAAKDALQHGIRAASFSVSRAGADAPTLKDLPCAP